jgi:hypothetical protein
VQDFPAWTRLERTQESWKLNDKVCTTEP